MCISLTPCITYQIMTFIVIFFFFLPFFLFLYFYSYDWLSFALCVLGGPQRTSDVLAPSWKYSLIANLFFLSISLERIVFYLVDHSCVKLMYHFKDCLAIGSVSLLLSPSKSKDHVPHNINSRNGRDILLFWFRLVKKDDWKNATKMQCLKVKRCLTVPVGKKKCDSRKIMTFCNVPFIIYIKVPVPVIYYTYELFSSHE